LIDNFSKYLCTKKYLLQEVGGKGYSEREKKTKRQQKESKNLVQTINVHKQFIQILATRFQNYN
jgi:hypothetical protein